MKPTFRAKFLVLISFLVCSQIGTSATGTSEYTLPYLLPNDDAMCYSVQNTQETIQPVRSGLWSNNATWPGGVKPTSNDDVVVPDGMTLTMVGECRAKTIRVEGTLNALKSQAAGAGINLEAESVVVFGRMEIGTASQPYIATDKCVITLTGGFVDDAASEYKAVMAMSGGEIEIHGKAKKSWTQLGGTAEIGDNSIQLKESVDWEVGDQIVIAPSGYLVNDTEVKTITAIRDNGKTLELGSSLVSRHYGEINTYKNGEVEFDLRAEVGLLSRTITIQGDEPSVTSKFGGHMMFMPGSDVKVAGVRLYRMGQEGILARYPFHWHLMEDATGQYFKNSTVHESYNRAVTIHGTDNALVEDVVAYDFIGHGFFLEDGDEEGNVFRDNLGIFARKAATDKRVRLFDSGVSVFWITNPNNTWVGNVATASQGQGFWFVPVTTPLREGDWGDYNPRSLTVKRFEGNTAHSNGGFNLGIDNTINPVTLAVQINLGYNPRKPDGSVDTVYIDDFTSYHSRTQSYWTRMAGPDILRNSRLGGSKEQFFQSFHGAVQNTLFVGKIEGFDYNDMPGQPNNFLGAQMYNGSTDFQNIHLAGFGDDNTSCIGTRRSSGKYPNYTISGVSFEDDIPYSKRVRFDGGGIAEPGRYYNYASGLVDLDGSLTGTPGARLTPRIKAPLTGDRFQGRVYEKGFNITDEATLIEDWNAYYTTDTDFGLLVFSHTWKGEQNDNPYYMIRSDGPAVFEMPRGSIHIPVILNDPNYKYHIQTHAIPNVTSLDLRWVGQNSFSYTNFFNIPSDFTIQGAPEVSSILELEASEVSAYYFKDNTIHFKNVADAVSSIQNTSVYYTDYSSGVIKICRYGNCTLRMTDDGNGLTYATLIDYGKGDDARDTLIAGQGLQVSPLSYTDGKVDFSMTSDGDGINEYVDYQINFDRQVWSDYYGFDVDYTGPNFTLFVNDAESGLVNYGRYSSEDCDSINMNFGQDIDLKDDVIGLTLRIYESDLSTDLDSISTQSISLNGINLHARVVNRFSARRQNVVPLGLLDTDGDGSSDLQEEANCRSITDPSDLSFDFDGVDEEFTLNEIDSTSLTPEGYWEFTAQNSADPYIIRQNLTLLGDEVSSITVRMKSERAGTVLFFWGHTNADNFRRTRRAEAEYTTENEWQEVTFDLSGPAGWAGNKITRLRFDFVPDDSASVSHWIDWMRGTNGNGSLCEETVISFLSPTATEFEEGHDLGVRVSVDEGTVSHVRLFLNDVLVRQEGRAPYDWGTRNANNTDPGLLNLQAGAYELKAVATNDRGVMVTETMNFVVNPVVTNTTDLLGINRLVIYPNPSESGRFELSEPLDYQVHDIHGHVVAQGNGDRIDLSMKPKGMYILYAGQKQVKLIVH